MSITPGNKGGPIVLLVFQRTFYLYFANYTVVIA
jgi:hypothetical protein